MFSFKPDRACAAGIALLVQSFAVTPALATEAAPLDDAVLRQSIAPTSHQDRDVDGPKSEPPTETGEPEAKRADVSQIVRPNETDLRTATPDLPLGLNIRPAASALSGLSDPATNLVFSANLSNGSGTTAP